MNHNFDLMVPCQWCANKEVRLSIYNQTITSHLRKGSPQFIDKCIKEYENAKSVRIKKSSD